MRTDTLENFFVEEIQDIRSVERQIEDAATRIAKGVSAKGLWRSLMQLLERTSRHVDRLDQIFEELEPPVDNELIHAPSIATHVRRQLARFASRARGTVPPDFARLTSREVEVLRLIAEGYANKQIAGTLAISIKTVEKHRQNLMAKLRLHDTAGVTRCAIAAGIVEAGT